MREEIQRVNGEEGGAADESAIEDIACVALNHLPPRYVRHDVDLIFYMSSEERITMTSAVKEAVTDAMKLVAEHKNH